jgi:hypothetical protein
MRIMLSALAAAAILGAANLAYAAEATGTIKSIDKGIPPHRGGHRGHKNSPYPDSEPPRS